MKRCAGGEDGQHAEARRAVVRGVDEDETELGGEGPDEAPALDFLLVGRGRG